MFPLSSFSITGSILFLSSSAYDLPSEFLQYNSESNSDGLTPSLRAKYQTSTSDVASSFSNSLTLDFNFKVYFLISNSL